MLSLSNAAKKLNHDQPPIAKRRNSRYTVRSEVAMRWINIFVISTVLLLPLSVTARGSAEPAPPLPPPLLRLQRGVFDAALGTGLSLAPQPEWAAPALGPYAIIQLRGPVNAADRVALERAGLTLLEYLPDYAYLVRGTEAQI